MLQYENVFSKKKQKTPTNQPSSSNETFTLWEATFHLSIETIFACTNPSALIMTAIISFSAFNSIIYSNYSWNTLFNIATEL